MVLASIVEACFAAVIDCYVFAVGSVEFSHHAYQKVRDIQNPKLSTIKATINYAKSHPCTIKMSVLRSIDGERFEVPSLIRTQKSSQQPFRHDKQNILRAQDGQEQTNKL